MGRRAAHGGMVAWRHLEMAGMLDEDILGGRSGHMVLRVGWSARRISGAPLGSHHIRFDGSLDSSSHNMHCSGVGGVGSDTVDTLQCQ